jgi:stringent starvation protein B
MTRALPKRPYLLRAMYQWIAECGHTPHVIVDAAREGTEVPRAYVKDGKIVLNLSEGATQQLRIGNEEVVFDARFAGVTRHVRFPVSAVLGIYARETGEGMVFPERDLGRKAATRRLQAVEGGAGRPQAEERGARRPQADERAARRPEAEEGGARRPHLKVIK